MRGFLKRNFLIFYYKSIIYILSVRFRSIGPQTPHIASLSAGNTATSCVAGPLCAGGRNEDPEIPVFGSEATRKDTVDRWTIIISIIEYYAKM
ncbi:hypothetical protein, partial [Klebsiella pneumoniae]|jgi:hypothetical protein|nr:hypothetical protein [Klebsiella michiganensis]